MPEKISASSVEFHMQLKKTLQHVIGCSPISCDLLLCSPCFAQVLRPERYSGIQEGESDVEEDPEEDEDRAKCVAFFRAASTIFPRLDWPNLHHRDI